MIVVIDVNALLSALIKDSTSRAIIVQSGLEFFMPEIALHKIRKYQEYVMKKSELSRLEFLTIYHSLLRFIKLIPDEELLLDWKRAKEIMASIDPEDIPFVAAALSLDAPVWSDDTHFEKQNTITVFKTKDMVAFF